MADAEQAAAGAIANEEEEDTPGYKPPAQKTLGDMLSQDKEDESLENYKKQLLGSAGQGGDNIFFPEDPRRVIVAKLSLVVEGREDIELDLTGDLTKLKDSPMTIKEGSPYRLKVSFYVQRDIVAGLKLVLKTFRKGIKMDTNKMMMGSYGPKPDLQHFLTPVDEAPSGMMARGHYTIHSLFTDDDKHEYLKWEWSFDIKKEWK